MGAKIRVEHLYWLGRYAERVLTTVRYLMDSFDKMIDDQEVDYPGFCSKLGIPNIYENTADFCWRYLFDPKDPNSILSNLHYAYDNAIVIREILSTESLSYIQMAVTAMESASSTLSPLLSLQEVIDNILAFRGSCEEYLDDTVRNIIRCGNSVERIDLYLRLGYRTSQLRRELTTLVNRLYKTRLEPDRACLENLSAIVTDEAAPTPGRTQLLLWVENLFSV